MVHIQHAPIAGRAVIAPLRLENIAHQAISTSFILWVAQVEAPKHWDLARVGGHWLEKGPYQQYEEDMEEG